jgi:Rrf2 family protein
MLSRKAKYALKALFLLARDQDRGPILISEIAERERIPKKFLELILLDLKNHGILQSRKGKGGGYLLARSPEAITLGTVVRITQGPLALTPCVSETAYRRCEECLDERTCGIRLAMKEVRDLTAKVLDGTSLADIQRRVDLLQGSGRGGRRDRAGPAGRA